MAEDPYSVLGVSKTATDEEIRSAYRKLAKKLHPDLNPGDDASAEEFKKVSAAYAILGDRELRAKFDAGEIDASGQDRPEPRYYREYAGGEGAERYYRAGSPAGDFAGFEDISDVFADLFGRDGGRFGGGPRPVRGRDASYALELGFLEAVKGGKKRITLPGGGALDLSVPPGIEDGQTIRLKDKGEPGVNGGRAGDALIEISVRPHPVFERQGDDIRIVLPVGFDEALLGAKVEAPTLDGQVAISIPAGSSSGQTLRLKGRGVKRKGRPPGDQYVELKLVAPKSIDEEFEKALKAWRARADFDPRRDWSGLRS